MINNNSHLQIYQAFFMFNNKCLYSLLLKTNNRNFRIKNLEIINKYLYNYSGLTLLFIEI